MRKRMCACGCNFESVLHCKFCKISSEFCYLFPCIFYITANIGSYFNHRLMHLCFYIFLKYNLSIFKDLLYVRF